MVGGRPSCHGVTSDVMTVVLCVDCCSSAQPVIAIRALCCFLYQLPLMVMDAEFLDVSPMS